VAPGNVTLQQVFPYDGRNVWSVAVENIPTKANWDFIVSQAICAETVD
jgi:hypothetical protein